MGQINILISINSEKLSADMPKGGKIATPNDYVALQDDQVFDPNEQVLAELTTFVKPGDMIIWTIKSAITSIPTQFTNIEAAPQIFLESPVLFFNLRKCIGVINKGIEKNIPHGYTIEFYLNNNPTITWYWDPFIEAREDDDDGLNKKA